ncbi:MAG: outer membrane lipoprotein-sorting protein [Deltaproteobacteria bacterium]|nr:outer membrane lipoprotein-sorting protein [Deltaproteobacteria bacterium]
MKLKLYVNVAVIVAFSVFVTRFASADEVAEILAKVDATLTKVTDQRYSGEMEIMNDGKVTKTLKFNVMLKGLHMKIVRFTAPGDVRGMTVLTTAKGHMYVYLPSYKRVRRVASHVRNQGFMGSDISPEDMGAASLSVGWTGTLISGKEDTEDTWVLDLKPKSGNPTTYSKLRIEVLKKYGGVSKLEYFNAEGKVVKTQVRSEWKTYGPITLPTLFNVKDERSSSVTVLRFSGCKVNTGISDRAFTKRAIMRVD